MFAEIDLLGAFVPAIAAWFGGSLALFLVADALLDQGRLLPAVLAQAARALRSIRLLLLRGRTGLEHELKGRGPMLTTVRVLLTLVVLRGRSVVWL